MSCIENVHAFVLWFTLMIWWNMLRCMIRVCNMLMPCCHVKLLPYFKCMIGFSYARWMLGFLVCVWFSFALWIDKYACLRIKMPWLCVKCMLVCVCKFRIQVLRLFLIGLRYKTQWWEANLRVGRSWVPNTFPIAYLNSEPILW